VDSYQEGEDQTVIGAIVYVEKSRRRIIVGRAALWSKIGADARQELIDMLGQIASRPARQGAELAQRRQLMQRLGYQSPRGSAVDVMATLAYIDRHSESAQAALCNFCPCAPSGAFLALGYAGTDVYRAMSSAYSTSMSPHLRVCWCLQRRR
jgi:hypothetical protein